MTARAVVFGFVLAACEAARNMFHRTEPKAVIHVLHDVECPPYFYLRIDEQVFAIRLRMKL